MTETTRRGAPTRRAISVAASASVGETIAPSVNALGPREAADRGVRDNRDAARRRGDEADREQRDRAEVRPQVAEPGEERGRVEERRQDRDEDEIRRQLQVRQPGHEAEQQAADDEQDRDRQPTRAPRRRAVDAERREQQEELQLVVRW